MKCKYSSFLANIYFNWFLLPSWRILYTLAQFVEGFELSNFWINFDIDQEKWTIMNIKYEHSIPKLHGLGSIINLYGMIFYFQGYNRYSKVSPVFQISKNGSFSIFTEHEIFQNLPTDTDFSLEWFASLKVVPYVLRHYIFSEVLLWFLWNKIDWKETLIYWWIWNH